MLHLGVGLIIVLLIAIPKTIKECDTEVVICPEDTESEYLIEIVTT